MLESRKWWALCSLRTDTPLYILDFSTFLKVKGDALLVYTTARETCLCSKGALYKDSHKLLCFFLNPTMAFSPSRARSQVDIL